ncbi:terminase gpP N-terminus-related DNA-binding protein [Cerasibacillus sp. JNUCC 74]
MVVRYKKAEINYNKCMKYKDIADKYCDSIITVKSWKRRYRWKRNKGAPKEKRCAHKRGESGSRMLSLRKEYY